MVIALESVADSIWIARRWKIFEGWGYAPLELRLTSNRKAARQLRDAMLGRNPERVIMHMVNGKPVVDAPISNGPLPGQNEAGVP